MTITIDLSKPDALEDAKKLVNFLGGWEDTLPRFTSQSDINKKRLAETVKEARKAASPPELSKESKVKEMFEGVRKKSTISEPDLASRRSVGDYPIASSEEPVEITKEMIDPLLDQVQATKGKEGEALFRQVRVKLNTYGLATDEGLSCMDKSHYPDFYAFLTDLLVPF